jgi:hypothetical protein
MIKLVVCGVWALIVSLASAYAAVSWQAARQGAPAAEKYFGGVETLRTKLISVPIVVDGAVQGYVVAQFIFTVDANLLKRLSVKPDVFLIDEAFKIIYSGEMMDFRRIKKQDLGALSKVIVGNVNKRFGAPFVDDVMIQELNYISKEMMRVGLRP